MSYDMKKLLNKLVFETENEILPVIQHVQQDSRKIRKGDLFVAIRGRNEDGHSFISDALKRGAAAVLVDDRSAFLKYKKQTDIVWVADTREAMPMLVNNMYDNPSEKFELIGVTGTNGKTSVTTIASQVLKKLNYKTALIGTINNMIGDENIPIETTTITTPDCLELGQILSQCAEEKADTVLMEVSSMALKNHRVDGCDFDIGVFLNLSPEHMDDHGTMEDYFFSKRKLFSLSKSAIINVDDSYAGRVEQVCQGDVFCFGVIQKERADLYAENIVYSKDGVSFDVVYRGQKEMVRIHVPCEFEVYNILAVLAICLVKEIPLSQAVGALPASIRVPGRYEMIRKHDSPTVIVDYAHTPEALQNLLSAIQKRGRYQHIITVFGCGGDRDRTKRGPMGKISQKYSDFTVITSDNPRTENPEQIIRDIEAGMTKGENDHIRVADRADAIRYAIYRAQPEDVVVIAGKGHETTQTVGGETVHFSDKEIVLRYLV